MLAQFRPLFLVAADRTADGGTAVIGLGIASNESGLLFGGKPASRPQVGARRPDGRTHSVVEAVKPGVLYFETR